MVLAEVRVWTERRSLRGPRDGEYREEKVSPKAYGRLARRLAPGRTASPVRKLAAEVAETRMHLLATGFGGISDEAQRVRAM